MEPWQKVESALCSLIFFFYSLLPCNISINEIIIRHKRPSHFIHIAQNDDSQQPNETMCVASEDRATKKENKRK